MSKRKRAAPTRAAATTSPRKSTKRPAPRARKNAKFAGDEDAEQRILDAARRVFISRGTSGARMGEIAAEAGVNQALIHYYFRSKDQLAERVFLEAAAAMAAALAPLLAGDLPPRELVERFVESYIGTMRRAPFMPGYLLSEVSHHPERFDALVQRAVGTVPAEVARKALARLQSLIDARVAAGEMRRMPARQLLVNVIALVVFPFVGRPIIMPVLGMDETAFERFLDERRRELPGFILNALRP